MDIRQNHFELFGLPERFALDRAELDAAYRALQGQVHPDRFTGAGDAEKRVALQWAARANEAYRTLRDPLRRAVYLCELRGAILQAQSNTAMPHDFLMEQMEWREALDEALSKARESGDAGALELLDQELREVRKMRVEELRDLIDVRGDIARATAAVHQLMFVEKFGEDIAQALETIES